VILMQEAFSSAELAAVRVSRSDRRSRKMELRTRGTCDCSATVSMHSRQEAAQPELIARELRGWKKRDENEKKWMR
jgi:hypothetical protein